MKKTSQVGLALFALVVVLFLFIVVSLRQAAEQGSQQPTLGQAGAKQAEAFERMSPAQHLEIATGLVKSGNRAAQQEGIRRLQAIPKDAPEYDEAQRLLDKALGVEVAKALGGREVKFTRPAVTAYPSRGAIIVVAPLSGFQEFVYLARTAKDFDEWFFSEEDETVLAERMVRSGRFLKAGPEAVKASVVRQERGRLAVMVRLEEGRHKGKAGIVTMPFIGVNPRWVEATK